MAGLSNRQTDPIEHQEGLQAKPARRRSRRDAAGNNASLSLSGVGSTSSVLVDGIPPATSCSISVPADKVYVAGEKLYFTLVFGENLTITGASSALGLTIGGAARSAAYDSKTANLGG